MERNKMENTMPLKNEIYEFFKVIYLILTKIILQNNKQNIIFISTFKCKFSSAITFFMKPNTRETIE